MWPSSLLVQCCDGDGDGDDDDDDDLRKTITKLLQVHYLELAHPQEREMGESFKADGWRLKIGSLVVECM